MSGGRILRKVIVAEVTYNPGAWKSRFTGGSTWYTLECGHQIRRKNSQPAPSRARCRECESTRAGSYSERRETRDGVHELITERWDPETNLPKRERRPMTAAEIAEWDDWGRRSDEAHRDDEARREADRADREAAEHDDRDPPE